jgi:NDP-sugar pyrophosphorylase family protein
VKFGADGAQMLAGFLDERIATGALRDWAPRAFGDFAAVRPLHVVGTRGYPWTEIDFPEDYERAVREILPAIEGAQFAAEEVRVNADTTIVVRGMRVPPDPQVLPLQRASGE